MSDVAVPQVVAPVDALVDAANDERRPRLEHLLDRLGAVHPAAWLTAFSVAAFAIIFGRLGVQNQRNFGTWSYDMGIYDQAIWLVSRGGNTFMSVRGLDVWGHHLNLVFYAFVPLYWLGAGPATLYVVQACALALGAAPTYLIARDRLRSPWMGLVFAVVYLMYAPVQWISWAMFHPESLVITPFLFAWWFAMHQRWRWFFAMVVLALTMREDTALAVIILGVVLMWWHRKAEDRQTIWRVTGGTVALGALWYLVATRLFIPHFNGGEQPFYIKYFYGNYGKDIPEIISNIIKHPSRVIADATHQDRKDFYWKLLAPWGGAPLAGPIGAVMGLPQMIASVIGLSPYARQINYQYTSEMIAPIVIAAVEGVRLFWRFRIARFVLPVWMLGCSYVTNVSWSPSPIGTGYPVWSVPNIRHEAMRSALALVPADASVTATYNLLPHLSHRLHIYDWPNPFVAAVWGNDDCGNLPDPTTVDFIVVDRTQVGAPQKAMFAAMIAPGGPFEVLLDRLDVVVAKRVGTSPTVDVLPQAGSCP